MRVHGERERELSNVSVSWRFLSNSLLILADETDSQAWRSPLKAISEFFKGDLKGDLMETGLHFPIGCCSNLCNLNASHWPHS